LEDWEKSDESQWKVGKKPKSKQHQDLLRAFELKFHDSRPSMEGANRRWSGWSMGSGISPGTSRLNSVDGDRPRRFGSFGISRRRSSASTVGQLSKEVTRDDGVVGAVATVAEED